MHSEGRCYLQIRAYRKVSDARSQQVVFSPFSELATLASPRSAPHTTPSSRRRPGRSSRWGSTWTRGGKLTFPAVPVLLDAGMLAVSARTSELLTSCFSCSETLRQSASRKHGRPHSTSIACCAGRRRDMESPFDIGRRKCREDESARRRVASRDATKPLTPQRVRHTPGRGRLFQHLSKQH